jgi:hypothetical protein
MNQEQAEQTPIVTNPKLPGDLAPGDYVFASRWGDCDWGDPWYVGHVAEIHLSPPEHAVPYPGYVVLKESPRRWPHAMRITPEQGRRIIENYPALERESRPLDYKLVAEIFGVTPPTP